MRIAVLWMVLIMSTVSGCERPPPEATPDGLVREFVEHLRGFEGGKSQAEVLFAMLSRRAQENLRSRAVRYGAASGKQMAPSAMIVPARFNPGVIQSYSARVVGKYALVDVLGAKGGRHAQIPCIYEEGVWRIDLVLPELPPMRMRRGQEQ